MDVHILVAIIGAAAALTGTVVGGSLVTAGNYLLARRREWLEFKTACRLIASELQQNYLTLEYYLDKKRWWRPDEELSTKAWKEYKHLLAPHLPYDDWDNVASAVINANQANVMSSFPRPPNNPNDFSLQETVPALTLFAQNMRKGRVGLMPYLL
jgi:hypothetical protein